ncbi:hypothetical protein C8D82_1782, partial [Victivallis vadensis]
ELKREEKRKEKKEKKKEKELKPKNGVIQLLFKYQLLKC